MRISKQGKVCGSRVQLEVRFQGVNGVGGVMLMTQNYLLTAILLNLGVRKEKLMRPVLIEGEGKVLAV
jgi:hypothetical protein